MSPTPLARVVAASRAVAATSKRGEKAQILADLLAIADPDELPALVGLLIGSPRQGRLGVGWAGVLDAVTADGSTTDDAVVIAGIASTIPDNSDPSTGRGSPGLGLTVDELDVLLDALAAEGGEGSQRRRQALLARLFGAVTGDEASYLREVLLGGVRQGALAGVVTEAVAKATGVGVAGLRRAAMLLGDLGEASRRAALGGDGALNAVGLAPGRGVEPMLAASAASIAEAIAKLGGGTVSVEWKLDGARVQVHRVGDDVRVYTRNLNEIGHRLPQVAELVRRLPADPLVLDGEILGLDADGRPGIFQQTMSRFASDEVGAAAGLHPFFFDVLHADGADLVTRSLAERHAVLDRIAAPWIVPRLVTADVAAAEAFGADALAHGHEGVMVKALDAPYEAGRRGASWVKVKPVRTLDLVVLAAEWGHGRRQGWLSNLHLGARAGDEPAGSAAAEQRAEWGAGEMGERFVMVGKTFKGLTDAVLTWQTEQFLTREMHRDRWAVYVRPELVVEIALDGVQVSRRYPGGVALRFARVRGYRPDRDPITADTLASVRALLPPARSEAALDSAD